MKILNKISHLFILLALVSCASSGDEKYDQKANKSCPQEKENNEDNGEIRIIHRSFLERINPINGFAVILGGIITDIDNMKRELNKNNYTAEKKVEDSNCKP